MRVLGIDPGLARTGVALVDGSPGDLRLAYAGCVMTDAGVDGPLRLLRLFESLVSLCAEHAPHEAAVEELFFASNRGSAMRVAEARGVILCALASSRVAVGAYTPLEVKETVAGWGAASKAQVARMAGALLRVPDLPGPDDTADACAIAICHHHRRRLASSHPGGPGPSTPGGPRRRRETDRLLAAVDAARRAAR